jgi:hypothetical protein
VVPEIGFDVPTQGIPSGDVESADVCSPTSDNAIQLVVFPKFIGDASEKVVRLADIHRIPVSVERQGRGDKRPRWDGGKSCSFYLSLQTT